jgi:hypothetical protein
MPGAHVRSSREGKEDTGSGRLTRQEGGPAISSGGTGGSQPDREVPDDHHRDPVRCARRRRVRIQRPERLVLAGFLTGYDGLTPEAYALHPPGIPPPSRPGGGIGGRPKQALMH